MVVLVLGVLLIIIAIILAAINLIAKKFDSSDIKWYFRGLFVVIGLIGIVLAAWGLMKKTPQKTS
jgi:spore maturation protein SpmA